jgi:glycosyltransferase involved in cell wall biosynthesis
VRRALGGEAFAAIHVQRSYLAAYLAPLLADGSAPGATRCSLDLDDDEALTHRRLADLHAAAGRPREAVLAAAEADKYVRYEAEWLPRFARLTTCSAAHAARLAAACPRAEVHPVPNSVALPGRVVRRFPRFGRHILFVGNLSYLPNADGIRRFILETLPLLRARHGRRLSVRIAGSAPPPDLLALAAREGVELVADPPELARHYRWADLAVIPLAAGGGTRIKLIEAFAHGVPVVSTSIGAEGIAAEDGRHLLLADAPEAFATACATLLDDRALATRLAREAHALVAERYAHGVGMAAIRAALPEA